MPLWFDTSARRSSAARRRRAPRRRRGAVGPRRGRRCTGRPRRACRHGRAGRRAASSGRSLGRWARRARRCGGRWPAAGWRRWWRHDADLTWRPRAGRDRADGELGGRGRPTQPRHRAEARWPGQQREAARAAGQWSRRGAARGRAARRPPSPAAAMQPPHAHVVAVAGLAAQADERGGRRDGVDRDPAAETRRPPAAARAARDRRPRGRPGGSARRSRHVLERVPAVRHVGRGPTSGGQAGDLPLPVSRPAAFDLRHVSARPATPRPREPRRGRRPAPRASPAPAPRRRRGRPPMGTRPPASRRSAPRPGRARHRRRRAGGRGAGPGSRPPRGGALRRPDGRRRR